MSQAEFSRRTGIHGPYINAIRNMDSAGPRGIGAEIVRLVRDGLRVDPDYFYDVYEGEKHHKLYLLGEKRTEKELSSIKTELAGIHRKFADVDQRLADYGRLAAESLEKDQRIAELERALARATKRRA